MQTKMIAEDNKPYRMTAVSPWGSLRLLVASIGMQAVRDVRDWQERRLIDHRGLRNRSDRTYISASDIGRTVAQLRDGTGSGCARRGASLRRWHGTR